MGPTPMSCARGFTLLETLAAIAILAVILSILAQISFQALSESVMTRRRAQGVLLAQGKMEEVLASREDLDGWLKQAAKAYPLDPEIDTRRFAEPANGMFRWSCEILDVQNNPGMKEIVVRTYWMRRDQVKWSKCELRTLLFAPRKGFKLFGGEVSADGRES